MAAGTTVAGEEALSPPRMRTVGITMSELHTVVVVWGQTQPVMGWRMEMKSRHHTVH